MFDLASRFDLNQVLCGPLDNIKNTLRRATYSSSFLFLFMSGKRLNVYCLHQRVMLFRGLKMTKFRSRCVAELDTQMCPGRYRCVAQLDTQMCPGRYRCVAQLDTQMCPGRYRCVAQLDTQMCPGRYRCVAQLDTQMCPGLPMCLLSTMYKTFCPWLQCKGGRI